MHEHVVASSVAPDPGDFVEGGDRGLIMRLLMFFYMFLGVFFVIAQSQYAPTLARSLDVLLQDYAFRAFNRPRTGVVYDGRVPSNLTGVKVSVMRLRSGSLRTRGVRGYKEFRIPVGVFVQPYVLRLALVYQNLGNWSSVYYPLPGYTYLTPVIGLLAYNAANMTGTNLRELDLVASGSPISINFANVAPVPSGFTAQCVWFDLDDLPELRDPGPDSACSMYRQGHFAIVVNSTGLAPAPSPNGIPPRHKSKSKAWKIVGGVVGGFVVLVLMSLILVCLLRYRQNKKVTEMERQADVGEALQMSRVGNTQAPVASVTRTQPALENEYVA